MNQIDFPRLLIKFIKLGVTIKSTRHGLPIEVEVHLEACMAN